MSLLNCVEVSVRHVIVLIFGLFTKKLQFLRFVLHTIMYTASCWVFVICRSNRLFRMFNKCFKNVLIEVCRSFRTAFYCPYFWTVHKKATFSEIRVAYNNVYRKLLGICRSSSASEMFVINNISNFEALIRKSIFAFKTRLSNSNNTIIYTLQSYLGYNRHNLESVER